MTGWPVWSLCQIAAVRARMRCRTRTRTPAGVLPPCRSRSSWSLNVSKMDSTVWRSGTRCLVLFSRSSLLTYSAVARVSRSASTRASGFDVGLATPILGTLHASPEHDTPSRPLGIDHLARPVSVPLMVYVHSMLARSLICRGDIRKAIRRWAPARSCGTFARQAACSLSGECPRASPQTAGWSTSWTVGLRSTSVSALSTSDRSSREDQCVDLDSLRKELLRLVEEHRDELVGHLQLSRQGLPTVLRCVDE